MQSHDLPMYYLKFNESNLPPVYTQPVLVVFLTACPPSVVEDEAGSLPLFLFCLLQANWGFE